MMGHLRAVEFTDVLEGNELRSGRAAHLKRCSRCQSQLREMAPYFESATQAGPLELSLGPLDSNELRRAVRDKLLGHAVRKSSVVPRWTGQMLTPAAAWGLSIALVVSGVGLGGFWHYQSAHSPSAVQPGTDADDISLFLDDPAALETEAIAWPEAELFVALNELEASEEETLRELIALTLEDNGI